VRAFRHGPGLGGRRTAVNGRGARSAAWRARRRRRRTVRCRRAVARASAGTRAARSHGMRVRHVRVTPRDRAARATLVAPPGLTVVGRLP